jgi:hypothetical protein
MVDTKHRDLKAIVLKHAETVKRRVVFTAALERGGESINELDRKVIKYSGTSVFFPTFRRLEGGYTFGGDRSS